MTLLQWKPAYSLAIPAVDLEHREMIGLINECYERMGSDADTAAIERFLGEIHAGIAAHFALEEQLMLRSNYPEYGAHKEDHEDLLDQIRDFMDRFDEDREAGLRLLQQRLADWFGRHFATFDARLHDRIHT
ncbi:MAG: bacteriohemerythrin [Xanthomonadales bacterium]|nr:bacteriohemerythrin [Xanthomonadales bacterium]NIN58833.1 bacteriohemerythrin [Xanthomonadales bacterium]NIN74101.1 bacteriohemerythrin [Xanthomonadales bacterium]NIO14634.1 bacteriohemerythrin [Xanthomonadales bacterium]NIP11226.1 bacteriohemerythrin [Xanthomonadales bacterium]